MALFAALAGGTAYAAARIGAKDIKPDAVRAKHIKAGQVKSAEIGDGQITPSETGTGVVDACAPGSLAGHAEVDASATFPAGYTGTGVDGLACEGPALAKRTGAGSYVVCFPELDQGAVGAVTASADFDNVVTLGAGVEDPACGGAAISVRNTDLDGGLEDADFSLLVAAG